MVSKVSNLLHWIVACYQYSKNISYCDLENISPLAIPISICEHDNNTTLKKNIRLVPPQDGPFFYTRSHLSALQNCALLFSTNFQFIFIFKKCITQFSHWIVSCTIFSKNIVQVFIKFTHSFVAIELLTFCLKSVYYYTN